MSCAPLGRGRAQDPPLRTSEQDMQMTDKPFVVLGVTGGIACYKAADLVRKIMDLGAEVEMYMGPELERHVFNQTVVIYIPPNFVHAPWRPLKTTRPWIFIEVNQGPSHTEKSFRQVLPKEVRERVDWSTRWKDEGYD